MKERVDCRFYNLVCHFPLDTALKVVAENLLEIVCCRVCFHSCCDFVCLSALQVIMKFMRFLVSVSSMGVLFSVWDSSWFALQCCGLSIVCCRDCELPLGLCERWLDYWFSEYNNCTLSLKGF